MPEQLTTVAAALEPVLAGLGLELFDVELTGSGRARTLRVVVDRDGGVDLDAITAASERISPVLDTLPPADAPRGPYALEVSSPGLERPLRRPRHFRSALGATVSVRSRDAAGELRRRRGALTDAGDHGITLEVDGVAEHVAYDDIVQARTVFEWGPPPKPGGKKRATEAARSSRNESGTQRSSARRRPPRARAK